MNSGNQSYREFQKPENETVSDEGEEEEEEEKEETEEK